MTAGLLKEQQLQKNRQQDCAPEYAVPAALAISTSQACVQLLNHARLAQLIHHRNKNQHRRSVWFRHFSIFRRTLHKLCREDLGLSLLLSTTNATATVASNSSVKNTVPIAAHQRTPTQVKADGRQRKAKSKAEVREAIKVRIQHWLAFDYPQRWYIAFTSLAATPSFAPLSLVLTALLARVLELLGVTLHFTALAKFEKQTTNNLETPVPGKDTMDDEKSLLEHVNEHVEDLGVVVPRT